MLEDKHVAFTELNTVGEFGLIDRLTRNFALRHKDVLKGPGDDCAVIDQGNGQALLVSTDTMMEMVHFDRTYCPLKHLGYKAAVTNFSDVFAMNGKPFAITVSLAVSNHYSVEQLEDIYEGIRLACFQYNVDLIGGDTTSSASGLGISITVLGRAKLEDVVYRTGALPNDLLCVTGDLGAAYAGLQLLEREKAVFLQNHGVQPDLGEYDYVIRRQLRPEARQATVEFLHQAGIRPTSMIDISDGLANEVWHLARAGQVGARVYIDKLPIDYQTVKTAELFHLPHTAFALYGGEDYELLFTLRPQDYEAIRKREDLHVIGFITPTPEDVQLVNPDDSLSPLDPYGYTHFGQK